MFFLKINFHFQSIINTVPATLRTQSPLVSAFRMIKRKKNIKNSVDMLYAVVVSQFQS